MESRTVFHRVVHRKAIGRVEQSGMQGEIGQIVHPLIVAAHIAQVQIWIIVGDGKKPVQQTVGVLECHGVEGGHTPRRSSRGLCRFDHGVPIFVVELVLHAARHAHIVTLQHGEERNARIGHHGQEEQETPPSLALHLRCGRLHGRSGKSAPQCAAAGQYSCHCEECHGAQDEGRRFGAQIQVEAIGHTPGHHSQRRQPAPPFSAMTRRQTAFDEPRSGGEQQGQQRAAEPTVQENQQEIARPPNGIGTGQAQDVGHGRALGANIIFVGDVAEHLTVGERGEEPHQHEAHRVVQHGAPSSGAKRGGTLRRRGGMGFSFHGVD